MASTTDDPIKFRCYKCNKLLGVPNRKVGSIVSCPQCRAELRVPRLEAAVEPSVPGAAAEVAVDPSPSSSPSFEGVTIPADLSSELSEAAPAVDDPLLVAIQVEPPTLRRDPAATERRPQDVVLSPIIVLAWSLLVLMAVPLAFIAGLLTGHFVWK